VWTFRPSLGPEEVIIVRRIAFGCPKAHQRGQGMVEYALILVLVSIVVIVILLTMGNQIQNVFSNIVAALG
jgi:pilus assembly protein Flp/PilA